MDNVTKEIMLQNDGLAQKFAYEFCVTRKLQCATFQFDDCLQCARLGLIEAIERYDESLGKLSTYAWYWMNSICLNEYKKCKNVLRTPEGKVISNDFVNLEDEIENHVSLEEEYITVEETIEDINDEHNPCFVATRNNIVDILKEYILKLPSRNAYVIILRFGLDGGEGRTCEEVGRMVDLTRDRISQIEAEGLRIIRRKLYTKEAIIRDDIEDDFSIGYSGNPIFEDVYELSYSQFLEKYYPAEYERLMIETGGDITFRKSSIKKE